MSTIKNLIDVVLYEKKDNLKIFYDVDIFLKRNIQVAPETEEPEEEPYADEIEEDTLNEEVLQLKRNGVLELNEKEGEDILTLNDLIGFLTRKKIGGKSLLDPITSEVILIMGESSDSGQQIQDVIEEEDKIDITIDYGLTKFNSIGLKLNKRPNTNAVSFLMRKDGKNLGPFNIKLFENQLLVLSRN